MKTISSQKKLDILSALDQGLSLREVAKRVSVSYGTVQSISSKERKDRIMPKKGRPKAISKTLTRVCIRNITTGQADTAVDIQRQLASNHDVNVASRTVENMMKRSGLKACVKVKKPFLSQRHRRLRLRFAKRYQNWTVDDWRRMVFLDKKRSIVLVPMVSNGSGKIPVPRSILTTF